MLYFALMFLLAAMIAWFYGFAAIALATAGLMKLLFFVFAILFVMTLGSHLMRSTN
ncbi:MAG TPA: hypothetical protein VMB18_12885 [Terriglobales bacterium]|jgi:uncharacterized membrane protein YtjA (UPF0391 family)|nr:hypothetical protein [Terriglobales bacterium]